MSHAAAQATSASRCTDAGGRGAALERGGRTNASKSAPTRRERRAARRRHGPTRSRSPGVLLAAHSGAEVPQQRCASLGLRSSNARCVALQRFKPRIGVPMRRQARRLCGRGCRGRIARGRTLLRRAESCPVSGTHVPCRALTLSHAAPGCHSVREHPQPCSRRSSAAGRRSDAAPCQANAASWLAGPSPLSTPRRLRRAAPCGGHVLSTRPSRCRSKGDRAC